jgi:hypothetical protein
MAKTTIAIALAAAMMMSGGSAGAADEPDAVELALEFGECAGLYFA